ncbi:MAG TPA: type II toxin-antitoxin system VapC family toxin [Acidobacteriota bacterium]|jgi:ribonuclease VapC
MILDSSAIVAVFFKEPGFRLVLDKLIVSDNTATGAPTLAEAGIVLFARMASDPLGLLSMFLQEFGVATIAFGDVHWREALEAYRRFGKGRHRAALNFGDCLSYAVAKVARQPLLCVGSDFRYTDIEIA